MTDMGSAKEAAMHEEALGWTPGSEKFVCADCIEDQALGDVVKRNAESKACSYCGRRRRTRFAAPLDSITEHMAELINERYTDVSEELPYDSESGEYVGTTLDGSDLLEDIEFVVENDELFMEIAEAFNGRMWCRQDYMALTPVERRRAGWDQFKKAVKHSRRFTFWSMGDEENDEYHPDYLPVGEMLSEMGDIIRSASLVKAWPTGSTFWRVRVDASGKTFSKDHELSPPPTRLTTQSNRMSPAGIAMFYGAEDFETACVETVDLKADPKGMVTGCTFRTVRQLELLDLSNLPISPSFFDPNAEELRHQLGFLRSFVKDLAQPIERDGREHIEYVPTQAFTEYVRFQMKTEEGKAIDGIRFPSSRNGKPCVVLFCGQDECVAKPIGYNVEKWMSFDADSLKTAKVTDVAHPRRTTARPHGKR